MKKIKIVDLFAGCGGLSEGFLKTNKYEEIASVEWLKPQVNTWRNRTSKKWKNKFANETVLHFDIQREEELFSGWNDDEFGQSKGLDYYIERADGIDVIIGGPPCQAYSVAGRVRDINGMKDDYRNYLFEHYLNVVDRYRPRLFVFENVPGILSAAPDGIPITEKIKKGFAGIDYEIIADIKKYAVVNASDYGVPQNRKRVIIVGIDKRCYRHCQEHLLEFYTNLLPQLKVKRIRTVRDAISDLPICKPYFDKSHHSKRISHETPNCDLSWHVPRYSNLRDMDTFYILAKDIESGTREYDSKKISQLYQDKIGSSSPIHRYHVLEADLPSTTIIAHLYKDGNRFIHYDSKQQRTITVREAARLQSFDDDFDFVGSQGSAYQMIGNAVPPLLASAIGMSIFKLITMLEEEG